MIKKQNINFQVEHYSSWIGNNDREFKYLQGQYDDFDKGKYETQKKLKLGEGKFLQQK